MRALFHVCLMLGSIGLLACEDADESLDCTAICDRFQDCVNEDYDTEACHDRCTDRADEMSSRDQEDACAECIDDISCGEAAFTCGDECVGIVP